MLDKSGVAGGGYDPYTNSLGHILALDKAYLHWIKPTVSSFPCYLVVISKIN